MLTVGKRKCIKKLLAIAVFYGIILLSWVMFSCALASDEFDITLSINFIPNWFFSRYDVRILADGNELGVLSHGTDGEFTFRSEDAFQLRAEKVDDSTVYGIADLNITGSSTIYYDLDCRKDRVNLTYKRMEAKGSISEVKEQQELMEETQIEEKPSVENSSVNTKIPDNMTPISEPDETNEMVNSPEQRKASEQSILMTEPSTSQVSEEESFTATPPDAEIELGVYEQDNNLENGMEPIKWILIGQNNGEALYLSKYALDSHQTDYFWISSPLKKWLNGNFLKTAFTEEERELLAPSNYLSFGPQAAEKEADLYSAGDKVFALSYKEFMKFAEPYALCESTPYAKVKEAETVFSGYVFENCNWWLRTGVITKRNRHYNVEYVDYNGKTKNHSGKVEDTLVRPAIILRFCGRCAKYSHGKFCEKCGDILTNELVETYIEDQEKYTGVQTHDISPHIVKRKSLISKDFFFPWQWEFQQMSRSYRHFRIKCA